MRSDIIADLQAELPHIPLHIISQGAEALIFLSEVHPYLPKGCCPAGLENPDKYIIKYRPPKPYRHPKLDRQITASRTSSEAKLLHKLFELGVKAPKLIAMDAPKGLIWMEFLGYQMDNGKFSSLKNWLWQLEADSDRTSQPALSEDVRNTLVSIGKAIGILHINGMVHGDLTTSNIVLTDKDTHKPSLIDFGLSSYSLLAEDKAVDLYVLERALKSTHPVFAQQYFDWVLEGYQLVYEEESSMKKYTETMSRFKGVRMRGRKRSMLG